MGSPSAKKARTTSEENPKQKKPILFSYWRSSCSWRVRIALEWKGIEYDYKPVHLIKDGGEHMKEEFTKINPNQRVPALTIDGHTLTQSGAILEYLEEAYPNKPLLPKDPLKRAQVRTLCLLVGADIQPVQNLAVLVKVAEGLPANEQGAKKMAWGKYWIQRGFVALEKELASSAGKYCVGDMITMADLFLEPQVYNASRFNVDMSQFPIISRIASSLADLAPFKAAHPANQSDAQGRIARNSNLVNKMSRENMSPFAFKERRLRKADRKERGYLVKKLFSMLGKSSTIFPCFNQHVLLSSRKLIVTSVDTEVVFGLKNYAIATTNGVRNYNEDRFRVINNLELYGKGIIMTDRHATTFQEILDQSLLEKYILKKNPPKFDVKKLFKQKTLGTTEFYGIFDGHGGESCSSLLALLFPIYLLRAPEFSANLITAANHACLAINDMILDRQAEAKCEGGSTALSLLIRNNVAYLCNVGDCRAILISRNEATALTHDHKAANESEKKRIESAGGMILYVKGVPRVNGRLAVTRSFGDSEFRRLVIPNPEITSHELGSEDQYIVMGSDGLWDCLSNDDVLRCIQNNPWLSLEEIANVLTKQAIEKGSMDNVTVLIVDVQKTIK